MRIHRVTACLVALLGAGPLLAGPAGADGPAEGPGARRAPQSPAGEGGEIMNERCRMEVEELHRFFQDWFNGDLPPTDETFTRFSSVISGAFRMVTPGGRSLDRAPLVEGLRSAHGRSREGSPIRIWVDSYRGREIAGGQILATYQEWQDEGAGPRGRLSTVLFGKKEGTPNGVEWLHVHETWLPEDE